MIHREPVPSFWWGWAGFGWTLAGLYVTWTPGTPPIAPYACGLSLALCLFGLGHNTVHRLRHRRRRPARPQPRHAAPRSTQ